ncbi:amino acid ABC transporter substrate-binding protein [Nocardioides speluncae]|uniref:amino acid ABC transporter substrate-binding protein n=1 Tax=Nocardioides speluncae TaxID=2670337 RepID=UPI000D693FCD|nr:amino acid ABC transporter substrate-binding protein [Nocardioides speluncae]
MNLGRAAAAGIAVLLTFSLAACGEGTTREEAGKDTKTEDAASLKEIQDAGVLKIGTEGTYKPFTFHADDGTGELTGFDVEVAEAVAGELGVKAEFFETQWDAIFAGLDSGRFDMIANQVTINDERKEKYAFSTPYTISPGVIVVRSDDDSIKSFADLKGKRTAQSLTSNWYEMAKNEGAKVEAVEGWAQAVTLLKQGRIDATVNDVLTFLDWQKTETDDSIKIAVESDEVAENAFTFRQGGDDLVEAVNKALADLAADGTLAKISEKYFGEDVTK